jgi:hypothetical protein
MKNRGYHPFIKQAPYAELFGTAPKSRISKHVIVVEPMDGEEKQNTLQKVNHLNICNVEDKRLLLTKTSSHSLMCNKMRKRCCLPKCRNLFM